VYNSEPYSRKENKFEGVYIITWWTTVYLTKQRSYLNQ